MHIEYWWKVRRKKTTGNRRSWVDNIKMDLREIECDGVDWIDTYQSRVFVNRVMILLAQ
jgi:hypothetical protein